MKGFGGIAGTPFGGIAGTPFGGIAGTPRGQQKDSVAYCVSVECLLTSTWSYPSAHAGLSKLYTAGE